MSRKNNKIRVYILLYKRGNFIKLVVHILLCLCWPALFIKVRALQYLTGKKNKFTTSSCFKTDIGNFANTESVHLFITPSTETLFQVNKFFSWNIKTHKKATSSEKCWVKFKWLNRVLVSLDSAAPYLEWAILCAFFFISSRYFCQLVSSDFRRLPIDYCAVKFIMFFVLILFC